MSDTPRTDALFEGPEYHTGFDLVLIDHGRQLERQVVALQAALRAYVIEDEYAGGADQPQTGFTCNLCGSAWGKEGESHEDGCLLKQQEPFGENMTEKTGTEILMRDFAGTRLDAIVGPLMRYAENYAMAVKMADRYGNKWGDEEAARDYRQRLEAALREAFTKIVTELPR